jgi:putative ABC transport system permease protein
MVGALGLLGVGQLVERPVRTLVTVLGIAIGVSVSVAIQTANVWVLQSFEETVATVAGQATLQVSGGDLGLDETVIESLRQQPAVLAATPILQQTARVAGGPRQGAPVLVVALDLLEAADLKGFRLRNERKDAAATVGLDELLAENSLFVGARLASEWGLQVGSPLDLLVGTRVYRLVVRGIVESEGGLPSAWESLAVMDIAAAQSLFGLVGRLDRVDLVTDPTRPVAEVAQALQALLPPPLTASRPARRTEQVERMVRAFQLNLATLSAVGLLVGLLLVYNTVSFAVVTRRREIGILRTLGLSRFGVSLLFVGQATMLGGLGGLVGSGLGGLLARGLVSLQSRTVSELYVPLVDPAAEVLALPPALWLQGIAIGILVSILGALVPSLEAGRTDPAQALAPGDYEVAQASRSGLLAWLGAGGLLLAGLFALPGPIKGLPLFGYASAFCLLLSLSCLSPALVSLFGRTVAGGRARWGRLVGAVGRVAANQVERSPGRSAVTVSSLMVGIAVMVGVGTMIQSFRHTVEAWVDQTVLADLVLAPPSWPQGDESGLLSRRIPRAWAGVVAGVPGVAAVDPFRQLRVEIQGRPMSLVARDLGIHGERSRYLFLEGDSRDTLRRTAAADGVIVSEVLAATLNVRRGDSLRLTTPLGERAFPIVGVFYDYATDGGKVVMDQALYHRLWPDPTTTVLAIYVRQGEDVGVVRERILAQMRETAGPEEQMAVIRNGEIKAEILAIFDRTFRVTYALDLIVVVIALLGIFNTLLTSVLERRRELATLRAIGASERQIGRLVLWEASYLGVLGGLLGLVGGGLLSALLIYVVNKQSFGWTIQFTVPTGLVGQAIGLALGVALIAGFLPALWAARQVIADGLRYE